MHVKNLLAAGVLGIAVCSLAYRSAHAQRGVVRVLETVRKSELVIESGAALSREAIRLKEALMAAPEVKLTKEDLDFARLSRSTLKPDTDAPASGDKSSNADDSQWWKFSAFTGNLKVGTFKKFGRGEVEGGNINLYATGVAAGGAMYCVAKTGSPKECAQRAGHAIGENVLKWTYPHDESAKGHTLEPSHSR